MAPIKRAADGDKSAVKVKHSTDDRAAKRQRKSEPSSNEGKAKPAHAPEMKTGKPAAVSVLKNEERSFPRGGASLLTPLEHKQIQIEATRDVLFEQSGNKRPAKDGESGDEMDVDGAEEGAAVKSSKKKRKGKDKKKTAPEAEEKPLKVEGLSYKRLVVGSLVLGQVTQITSRDVALALPNNLTGYVPMTAISNRLTARMEKLLAEIENENDEHEEEEYEDINLHKLFTVGQYLRAYVQSVGEGSKRHIELSLNPTLANTGMTKANAVVSSMVQASVKSVEGHGLVMDVGLGDDSLKGFMSSKEVGYNVDHTKIEEGAVFLCLVTGTDNNLIKLSADHQKAGDIRKKHFLTEGPNVDLFLPGTAVELLVTDSTATDLRGQIMGMLDATADLIHSGAGPNDKDIEKKYKLGSKIKARIIYKLSSTEKPSVGVSLLEHVTSLSAQSAGEKKDAKKALESLPLSTIVEEAKVLKVSPKIGLFLDVGVKGVTAFAHISRLSEKKIDSLSSDSGPYKIGSTHRARVVGYNPVDGLYIVSLEQHVLDQPFLRIEDIKIGQVVTGKVEKLVINAKGVGGVLVNLAEGITGLAPEMHMADVHLQHPERKFKEGLAVKARVVSTDPEKRLIRLTLKKTLVNSDEEPWLDYSQVSPGDKSLGTVVNITPTGAVMQFYGNVRAFLPVAEMSEAYIKDPSQHFRIGQTVSVWARDVDPNEGRMTVTCKDPSVSNAAQQQTLESLSIGGFTDATVTEISADQSEITLDVNDSGLKAVLRLGHLTDGSDKKDLSALKRIRVGQKLQDLLVLEKLPTRNVVVLSNKPSLIKQAKAGNLITKFEDIKEGHEAHGFVRHVTSEQVFIQFGGGIVGLLHRKGLEEDMLKRPDFGLLKDQSISAHVSHINFTDRKFFLTKRPQPAEGAKPQTSANDGSVVNPVDVDIKSINDFALGKITKARINKVTATQLNVRLADKVQGRIDFSEVFDDWESIEDPMHALQQFKPNQELAVKILGIHDARSHRFLPITHRGKTTPVFELTAKASNLKDNDVEMLTLDKIAQGSSWIAFVNNVGHNCVWLNLSPNVRGRISFMDLTDNASLLGDVEANFPVGSAMKVKVKDVNVDNNRLTLTAATAPLSETLEFQDVMKGMILAGRVTKISERYIIVQLGPGVIGQVSLTELVDDYSQANPTNLNKNEIVRVCVVDVDRSNKKIHLSTRPSRILSSSMPVVDPHIDSIDQLKVNDVVRGFVKNVSDKGVFIALSPIITAFVRISDLSDKYIKDWKSIVEVDQVVKGKVMAVDPHTNNVQLSLKASVLDANYVPPLTFNDLKVGQIVTGKVRKVEDFGVFIVVDNSANVSGICHRSEIADEKVTDVKKLYQEGDIVKAKVIKIEKEKRRVNFGLKASYFRDNGDTDEESDDEDAMDGVVANGKDESDEEMSDDGGVNLDDTRSVHSDNEVNQASENEMEVDEPAPAKPIAGLKVNGFDWIGTNLNDDDPAAAASDEGEAEDKPKKRRKAAIQIDRTGELDKEGPQSVADYERLLLGQPNSSELWIQYMAFQLGLSEVDRARDIAKRALKTGISIGQDDEKFNVWVAWLNLEVSFGSDESVEEVFKEACQYNDKGEMHRRLASIYIASGKHDKAEELYQAMTKIRSLTVDQDFWLNYATFLMSTLNAPDRARALLQRATQSVPQVQHRELTARFAALEFQTPNGDPERGRTIFEGLLSTFPKRHDLWDMFIAQEVSKGEYGNARALLERLSEQKMNASKAKRRFKFWLEFEEKYGDGKSVERVTTKAREVAERLKSEAEAGAEE